MECEGEREGGRYIDREAKIRLGQAVKCVFSSYTQSYFQISFLYVYSITFVPCINVQ